MSLNKNHLNTAYQWGIVVGPPNLAKWTGGGPNDLHFKQIGLWALAAPDSTFRTLDGKEIMAFNSEEKAKQFAEHLTANSCWNYEAKKIPNKKT